MGADRPAFFSRDELLGGLLARRASALLFAIESRTAQLVARSRRALATGRLAARWTIGTSNGGAAGRRSGPVSRTGEG